MAYDPHGNLSYGAVAVAPSPAASGVSLTLSAGQGADFPAPGAQGYNVTIWPAGVAPLRSNAEIARVTGKTGDVLTIVRAQEGTSARTILVGDQIANTVTAKVFEDIENAIPLASQFVAATAAFAGTNASGTIASTGISVSVGPGGAALKGSGTYTQRSGTIEFTNSNGVTFGLQTDGVMTASVQTNYQTPGAYLTTARASNDAIGLNTAKTNVTWTVNSSGLSLDAGGYAGTNGAITGGSITVNSSGVSVNLPAYLTNQSTQYLALTLGGNTAGVTTFHASNNATLFFHGGNNITLSGNGSSVTISGANVGGAQTGISGIAASDTTYTSGSVTFSGVGGGVTVNSNTGQRVDISVAAPVAQTVQTQNMVAVSLSGNTAGVLALVSSGTAILAGGNNITLSQNGQSITISGANVGGAQTGISGVVVSDATYTSGTIRFSNAGNVTISSSVDGASQYIRLSGNAAQTNQSAIEGFGVSNTGQTAGNTGISTGVDWVLAGSGSITLSQSTAAGTNTVWIQHPAWITTATQSTQFLALTLGGNTAGTSTFHATNNATIFLHGGNNITLSGNGSSVTISGANVGGAQTGISGIVVSDTTYTSGTVSFSNAGNITISSSVDGATQYIRLSGNAAQTVQTQSLIAAVYDGANSISTGTVRFTNANGVSFSINGQTISGSVVQAPIIGTNVKAVASIGSTGTITRYAPEDHQHAGVAAFAVTNTGNTLGNTRSQVGTLYIAASGAITASQSTAAAGNDTVWLSVAAQTNQSAIRAFGVSNTGQTAGNTGVSTGVDWVMAGSQSITLSQSTAGGGPNTVWVQHPAWISSQSTQFLALTLGGNSAGTSTFHATNNASLFLNGGNNITLSGNGSTVTISAAAQTNQSLGLYAVSNTTGESSSSTFDARTLSFHGAGIASVGYSNGSVVVSVPSGGGGLSNIRVSAGTTSNLLSAITFSDANGVSWGIDASTITATVDTYDTVGTATTVYSVASANSVGTVTRWAAEDHRHAGVGGLGISTSGNTAGTTGSRVGTYWLEGGNNITVSQITSNNGSHTIVLSGAAAGITGINVSAGTTSNDLTNVRFQNSNSVSFGINASTVTASIPAYGTMSMYPNVLPASTAVSTYYSGSTSSGGGGNSTLSGYTFSLYIVPMALPGALAFSELRIGVSNSRSTAGTGSVTHLYSIGIYSNNASTLSKVEDYYGGLMLTQNSVTAQTYRVFTFSTGGATAGGNGGFAGLATSTVYSSQGNISANSQMDGAPGVKWIRVDDGVATTLTAGQYYCVLGFCSVVSSANVYANVGVLQSNAISSVNIPDLGRENSTQTSNYLPGWGAISTTYTSGSNAASFFPLPNAINLANVSQSSSAWHRFHFPFMRNHS